MERVISYIDGFNLYFGLRSKRWRRFYWLNLHGLSSALLKPGQSLAEVRYFTSRISSSPSDPDRVRRQNQLPDPVVKPDGIELWRPAKWK